MAVTYLPAPHKAGLPGQMCIFPAHGYYEIDGKPVGELEAQETRLAGMDMIYYTLDHSDCCFAEMRRLYQNLKG